MNRLKIILRENETLHEMLLGIGFANLIILIIGLIICKNKVDAAIGVLVGCFVAVFYVIHMAVTIDDALCLDEKGAAAVLRKNMLIRYGVVCLVVALISYFELCNPILCIFSCLTIKIGAYLQPVIHNKILKRSDTDSTVYEEENLSGSENGGKISE